MKCIICSKETNNENEICDKCHSKQKKRELKDAKMKLKRAQFEQVDYEHEPEYGRMVYTTGMRSSIISLSSSIAALLLSIFVLPGFIFGLLGLVEGIITLIDVIRNNKRGHKRMLPLAFAIVGIFLSLIAFVIAVLSIVSIVALLVFDASILILALVI
jgi:hypothetical protein